MIFDILDANTVLMTTIGLFENEAKSDPDEKPMVIAYSMVWRRENDVWKLFHMHNSWE